MLSTCWSLWWVLAFHLITLHFHCLQAPICALVYTRLSVLWLYRPHTFSDCAILSLGVHGWWFRNIVIVSCFFESLCVGSASWTRSILCWICFFESMSAFRVSAEARQWFVLKLSSALLWSHDWVWNRLCLRNAGVLGFRFTDFGTMWLWYASWSLPLGLGFGCKLSSGLFWSFQMLCFELLKKFEGWKLSSSEGI